MGPSQPGAGLSGRLCGALPHSSSHQIQHTSHQGKKTCAQEEGEVNKTTHTHTHARTQTTQREQRAESRAHTCTHAHTHKERAESREQRVSE